MSHCWTLLFNIYIFVCLLLHKCGSHIFLTSTEKSCNLFVCCSIYCMWCGTALHGANVYKLVPKRCKRGEKCGSMRNIKICVFVYHHSNEIILCITEWLMWCWMIELNEINSSDVCVRVCVYTLLFPAVIKCNHITVYI